MLGILCTSYFVRINPVYRFPCTLCLQTLALYLNLIELYTTAPNFRDRSIVMVEQGVIAVAALDAVNGTIDSIAKL